MKVLHLLCSPPSHQHEGQRHFLVPLITWNFHSLMCAIKQACLHLEFSSQHAFPSYYPFNSAHCEPNSPPTAYIGVGGNCNSHLWAPPFSVAVPPSRPRDASLLSVWHTDCMCVWVCMYVCACMCTCAGPHLCGCTWVCLSAHMHMCACACVYACTCVGVHLCGCTRVHVCTCEYI